MANNLLSVFIDTDNMDAKSAKFLVGALEKNNITGFDYLEFKQALDALTKMNMDESMAFKSAFATASTMGLTRAKLLETAQYYKKILEQEKGQFQKALQQQVQKQIAGKEHESKSLILTIEQKQKQIARLQAEIEKHKARITDIKTQIDSAASKINATKDNFEVTFDKITEQIDQDLRKIEQYL